VIEYERARSHVSRREVLAIARVARAREQLEDPHAVRVLERIGGLETFE
jgi:hypothetical protein